MTGQDFLSSTQFSPIDGGVLPFSRDGSASIASQLKSGFNHTVSAMWQAERQLHKAMFIFPIFISVEPDLEEPINGMPGAFTRGVNKLLPYLKTLVDKGLQSVILFGSVPNSELKDATASIADSPRGPILPVIPKIREAFPALYVIADISFSQYTHHGHSILFEDGTIDNEASVARVSDIAIAFARAGAHCVAPSDMSDGRIRAIKLKLIGARLESKVALMSYSAKFASCLYQPYFGAVSSTPSIDDRRSYLLPPPARRLAHRAIARDIQEGADMIMVKPAYTDIIRDARSMADVPIVAMQVSGEYAVIQAAAQAGVVDLKQLAVESVQGIFRAGADVVISYFTPHFLDWLS
ncbi:hypothetical protein PWT90_03943 [Aphanocladium album]|nr:hypothetical protein PWT90_03943 [Aphanocladium album]